MFNYLAKCGWLFDGFFSHGHFAVESILQLTNSTIGLRTFGSGAGAVGCPLGGRGLAPLPKILRRIVEFVNGFGSEFYYPDNFTLTIESSSRLYGALVSAGGTRPAEWIRDERGIS